MLVDKDEQQVADNTMQTKHFSVRGRVQGVYYRRSTQQQAKALGLTGWVRNLADGSVELVATGSPESLKQLESWLWQGPPKASVTAVESRDQALTLFDTFEVVV